MNDYCARCDRDDHRCHGCGDHVTHEEKQTCDQCHELYDREGI